MKRIVLESDGPEATHAIGCALGAALWPGARIGLSGPLGAGKTRFVQGLADGLGCANRVRSPSYVLVHEYRGRCLLIHCDWYRLDTEGDVESTGFEDLLDRDAVIAVEWAEKHPDVLPPPRLDIRFDVTSPNTRRLTIVEQGAGAYTEALSACAQALQRWVAGQKAPSPVGTADKTG